VHQLSVGNGQPPSPPGFFTPRSPTPHRALSLTPKHGIEECGWRSAGLAGGGITVLAEGEMPSQLRGNRHPSLFPLHIPFTSLMSLFSHLLALAHSRSVSPGPRLLPSFTRLPHRASADGVGSEGFGGANSPPTLSPFLSPQSSRDRSPGSSGSFTRRIPSRTQGTRTDMVGANLSLPFRTGGCGGVCGTPSRTGCPESRPDSEGARPLRPALFLQLMRGNGQVRWTLSRTGLAAKVTGCYAQRLAGQKSEMGTDDGIADGMMV
jgi:hypothetical protein